MLILDDANQNDMVNEVEDVDKHEDEDGDFLDMEEENVAVAKPYEGNELQQPKYERGQRSLES